MGGSQLCLVLVCPVVTRLVMYPLCLMNVLCIRLVAG